MYLKEGIIKMPHCETQNMIADPLTKPMAIQDTISHMKKMSGLIPNTPNVKHHNIDEEEVYQVLMAWNTTETE
jgi:hypothetical protein